MSQPAVNITEIDGALGVLPSGTKVHAAVGVSSAGPLNTPAAFARTKDVISTYEAGPLVEYACHYIETYQRPIVLVRSAASVAGLPGTLVTSGVTGTSVVTIGSEAPNDDYEAYFKVVAGGTLGVAGITFVWSLDGGRTLSPVTALGTALTFTFPGSGGLNLDFAAGTLVAGDFVTSRTTAPNWNAADLSAALQPLHDTTLNWREVHVVGPIDANAFDAIEVKMAALSAAGKPKHWAGNTRVPTVGETEAAYRTAMETIFSSKATVYGNLCSGACKLTASGNVPGRKYKRPVSWTVAARGASVSDEIDIADVNLGALPGVSIRDANGNLDEHDESANPGLDDARFTVLRTHDGYPGVYVNRPRLFSAPGSDFYIVPFRLVANLTREALRTYFVKRLNRPVLVNTQTGFILEEEALDIEDGADGAVRAVLMAKPKASGGGYAQGKFVQISRTDNLLSTRTIQGNARVVPLAYIETINLDVGFVNPALVVQAA
jgi:hypothetical protein